MADNTSKVEQRVIVSIYKFGGWGRIIVGAIGNEIIEEINNAGSRFVEDIVENSLIDELPKAIGLWTWIGKVDNSNYNELPRLIGEWRKTTIQDLVDTGLIDPIESSDVYAGAQ